MIAKINLGRIKKWEFNPDQRYTGTTQKYRWIVSNIIKSDHFPDGLEYDLTIILLKTGQVILHDQYTTDNMNNTIEHIESRLPVYIHYHTEHQNDCSN